MATIKNVFTQGIMDKDTDKSLIKTYRHAENLRFHINDGNDGVGVNIKGTQLVSDATDNNDYKCIGAIYNEDNDRIYYFITSKNNDKIIEYDISAGTTTEVLVGSLDLYGKGYITGINEIDGKLYWALFGNNPRRIDVEQAKQWISFVEDDIVVIQQPPLQKLKIELVQSDDIDKQENHIEEKFLSFSYRYRFTNNEYSVLAPFTEFAFEPKTFDYNFAEQSNLSMINKFDKVNIKFNTGSYRVKEIQLVVRESNRNEVWIIDDFNKELLGYGDNEIREFLFDNQKIKRALPEHIVKSFFDNVPKTTKAQTIIDNRLIYGNYIENYDIVDENDNTINIDFSLNLLSTENNVTLDDGTIIPSGIPKRTIKSNRDIEVMIAYGFEYGRMSTLLPSKTNTIYIPIENSVTENKIQVELRNKPPKDAKWYRFFVRESTKDYDTILPTLFYEDGVYRWIKLDGKDIDKIDKGDYLVIKADSARILKTLQKTKVLEKEYKEKDFLGNDEESGMYIKIMPDGFYMNLLDMDEYELTTAGSEWYLPNVYGFQPIIEQPHFYGVGLNDLTTSGTSTLSGDETKRIAIRIDEVGSADKFVWREIEDTTWSSPIEITGNEQDLDFGVKITFANVTGHELNDEWYINVRGEIVSDSSTCGFFRTHGDKDKTMTDADETTADEIIHAGARITLEFNYPESYDYWKIENISSREYDNIEEWYYMENIGDAILLQYPDFDLEKVFFGRGVLQTIDYSYVRLNYNTNGYMTMIVKSDLIGTAWANSHIIQRSDYHFIILETEAKETPKDIFYEIGKTYLIENGLHTANSLFETEIEISDTDTDQTDTHPALITLDWFNAYSYGNGVESYKIKDEFNAVSLDDGVRVLSDIDGEYKETHRASDLTWSDVYVKEMQFNGLSTFNLSLANFETLNQEQGSIQKLFNDNGNLLILQQGSVGIMPYNKQVIYDTTGGQMVGISTNILDAKSYRPYASGIHGISNNPESFVANGSRKYFTDALRGDLLRIAQDGLFELNRYWIEHYFSNLMNENKGQYLVGAYDPKHKEYLLYLPATHKVLIFKETAKGFPQEMTFEPDFMLGADNDFYAWKDGKMYKMNATEQRNTFFGITYPSKLKFYVNEGFDTEKIYRAIGLESTHAWDLSLSTNLTSRQIPVNSFVKKEDYWYSEIMGNTNNNALSNSKHGLGVYPIENGQIYLLKEIHTLSVGDYITNQSGTINEQVINIDGNIITLANSINAPAEFLMYQKNANIDGEAIRGDILEVDMEIKTTDKVEIRAVRTDAILSNLP